MLRGSNCEHPKCQNKHEGDYGLGRFCSASCARSFSSYEKRALINRKVSKTLKGRNTFLESAHYNESHYRKLMRQRSEKSRATIKQKILSADFSTLGRHRKRMRIFYEQNSRCLKCELATWNNLPIVLELDHKDGDQQNVRRSNLRLLCPNCHSQTPTWRRKKHAIVAQRTEFLASN